MQTQPISLPALAAAGAVATAMLAAVGVVAARAVRRQTRRGSGWRQALVLGFVLSATAAAALLFVHVADEVREEEWLRLDASVRAFALAHRAPALDVVFRAATLVGSAAVLAPLCLVGALLLWRWGRRRLSAVVISAALLGAVLFPLLKAGFERTRPAGALAAHLATYSFPSGHATTSAAVALTCAWVLARERLLPAPLAAVLGVLAPLIIGASRVYLDVHWASDVLAGWAVGAFVAALCAALYEGLGGPDRAL